MALELASYDLMPSEVPGFAKGFTAALFATSLCYPLDTVRSVISSMMLSSEYKTSGRFVFSCMGQLCKGKTMS